MSLWIDVYDTASNKLGDGPVFRLNAFSHTWRLDRMGDFSFTMAATDPRASLIVPGRMAVAYGMVQGTATLLGGGVIRSRQRRLGAGSAPLLTVSGDDMLVELRRISVEDLQLTADTTGPADVMAYASGSVLPGAWSMSGGSTAEAISHDFTHESILEALTFLADVSGEHFRLDLAAVSRAVSWLGDVSSFASSGVVATNLVEPLHVHRNANVCLVTGVSETVEIGQVVNRVYAFGGDGTTLANITTWPGGATYSGGTETLSDGDDYSLSTSASYLQNDDSVTALDSEYHARMDFSEIQALSGSTPDLQAASNLLARTAYHWMRTRKQSESFYTLDVVGLDTQVQPGETIDVLVRQFVNGERVIDIDAPLNVLAVTVNYDARGARSHRLEVSSVDRYADTDGAVAVRQARQLAALARG